MASSYSASCRFNLQGSGDNPNAWGSVLNTGVFALVDSSVAGWATIALTGDTSLTTANGSADQARMAMLKLTGTGAFSVTVPAVSKSYLIWNACTGVLTITNGSTSTTIQSGEKVAVMTDGGANIARVQGTDFGSSRITSVGSPTANTDAATKGYVDGVAFSMAAGALPGQTGNSGKFLTTDGSVASWGYAVTAGAGLASVSTNTLTVTAAAGSDVQGGVNTSKAVTAGALANSAAFGTLTDAATVAWEILTAGYNATVTLGGNRAIGAPTLNAGSLYDGCCLCLELVQDGTGSRVPTWNSVWDWGAAGTPVLQTTAAKRDLVFGIYRSATSKIHATFRKGA